jgi:hypothetical protein
VSTTTRQALRGREPPQLISTRAALELTDDNLRCSVDEYSKGVKKPLEFQDFRSRLQAGEAVAAFDFRRGQLKINLAQAVFEKQGFPLAKGARTVGWRPWFIPLESLHWWRWWTAGTFTFEDVELATLGVGALAQHRPPPRLRPTDGRVRGHLLR